MGVRRWNGWIDEDAAPPALPAGALRLLEAEIGPGTPSPDASLEDVVAAVGDPADAVVLTADFNASPTAPSRRLFGEAGLGDSAEQTGKPTFQLYGIGLSCLDGILVNPHWRVHQHLTLDVKPGNTFPSDHFGLLADLALRD